MLFTLLVGYAVLTGFALVTSVGTNIYIDNHYTRPGMGTSGHFIPKLNELSNNMLAILLMPIYAPYRCGRYVYYNYDKILEMVVDCVDKFLSWIFNRMLDCLFRLKRFTENVIIPLFEWIGRKIYNIFKFVWTHIIVRLARYIHNVYVWICDAIDFVWDKIIVKLCHMLCDLCQWVWSHVIVRAFRLLVEQLDIFVKWLETLFTKFFTFVYNFFVDFIRPTLERFVIKLWEGIRYIWTNVIVKSFDMIYNLSVYIWSNVIVKTFKMIDEFVQYARAKLVDFFVYLVNSLCDFVVFMWQNVLTKVFNLMDYIWTHIIVEIFATVYRAVTTTCQQVLNLLQICWRWFADWIIYPCWELLKVGFSHITNLLYSTYEIICKVCRGIRDSLIITLGNIWNALTVTLSMIWDSLTFTLSKIWNTLTVTLSKIWDSLTLTLSKIWDSLTLTLNKIWDSLTLTLNRIWDSLTLTLDKVWNSMTNSGRVRDVNTPGSNNKGQN